MKEWKKPELQNLALGLTKEDAQPYYWWPKIPACDNPANTGEGYQMCTQHGRKCKYFITVSKNGLAECSAPVKSQDSIS